MKRKIVLFLFTVTLLLLNSSVYLSAVIPPPGENNSVALYTDLSSKILSNPSGELVPFYINKIMEVAPYLGRTKTSGILTEAFKKLEKEGKAGIPAYKILKLSIDELNGSRSESIKDFSIIKRWNISGPWKRYGKPDIDYPFPPERVFKIEEIEKGRNISTEENGVFFPFKFTHQADETIYAVSSFTAAAGIELWIQSDSGYKLIINGREVSQNISSGTGSIRSFALKGARGYTVQVKMLSGPENRHPYLRGMVTDENHLPVQLNNSSKMFTYSFTFEKIFSPDESGDSVPNEASILTGKMKLLVHSGDYTGAYKLGVLITDKFPMYSPAYSAFFPLLDIMNKDDKFLVSIEKFRKAFPDSDIHYKWLADFYISRDREKFKDIMKSVSPWLVSEDAVESYLYLLCGEKKYSEALNLCTFLEEVPRFREVIPEVIRSSGDNDLWRKALIEGAALRNESYFYYSLGLAEIQNGLDPAMYWEKGYSLDDDDGLMRDLTGIYENGILGSNEFYTGVYTDLHPEFRWKAKKRKISIHLFESGRVILEGEDLIPSGSKILNKKYSEGGSEFSSGEMKSSIPYFKDLKILYVLTAKDGLPTSVNFKSDLSENEMITVRFKCSGEEEFSVIKYSGEYRRDKKDIFTILKNLVLKSKYENISELDYEVICHGNFIPLVNYNGESLSPGRYSGGIIKFWSNEKLSDSDNEGIVSGISKFSSGNVFATWYSKVITYSGQISDQKISGLTEKGNIKNTLKTLHFYIMSSILKRGDVDFTPRRLETVLFYGEGTVEERTLLAKAILEKRGIKSFVSFKKSRDGLIDKILLYVPENRDSGFWLDFYGESISDKMESGYDAIVITGEGCETFPVNPETYIR